MSEFWPIRLLEPFEIPALARVWHDAWHEAHGTIVPLELVELRDLASFQDRIVRFEPRVRVAGPPGAPIGLCAIVDNRIDQIYLAEAARGTGLADRLLADGESRLARSGHTHVELDCAADNRRAIRFYDRCGWIRRGIQPVDLDTRNGNFRLDCMVFDKELEPAPV